MPNKEQLFSESKRLCFGGGPTLEETFFGEPARPSVAPSTVLAAPIAMFVGPSATFTPLSDCDGGLHERRARATNIAMDDPSTVLDATLGRAGSAKKKVFSKVGPPQKNTNASVSHIEYNFTSSRSSRY